MDIETRAAFYFSDDKRPEAYGVPDHMVGGLLRYMIFGIRPGHFLSAVLSNDLMDAMGRADHINLERLPCYGKWLYNAAPIGSYGSPEAFEAWIKRKGMDGAAPPPNVTEQMDEEDELVAEEHIALKQSGLV